MPSRLSVLPAEAVTDPRLTDGDVRVLAAIGTFTDREGKCWPSVQAVARVSSRSPRSVQRSMAVLAELGYLVKVSRWGRSNVYVVKLDTPATSVTPDSSVGGGATEASGGGDTSVTQNVPKNGSKKTITTVSQRNPVSPEQEVCAVANQSLRENLKMRGESAVRPLMASRATQQVRDWLAEGIPLEVIKGAVARVCEQFVPTPESPRIGSFKYFDASVRKAYRQSQALSESQQADQVMASVLSQMQKAHEQGVL